MRVNRILLRNFRSYSAAEVEFCGTTNIIIGHNALGKTNLLEAIYMAATGRSFRTARDSELVKWGEEAFAVRAEFERLYGPLTVEVRSGLTAPKSVKINGTPAGKVGDLLGAVNIVFFGPDDLALVKGAPVERRRFLDFELAQVSPRYRDSLVQFTKILQHRNSLLRRFDPYAASHRNQGFRGGDCPGEEGVQNAEGSPSTLRELFAMLDVWDKQLASYGGYIMAKRHEAVERLKTIAGEIHARIARDAGDKVVLDIIYQPSLEAPPEAFRDPEAITRIYERRLFGTRMTDLRRGTTLTGPHRDDISFSVGGVEVRAYASQGQQRTVALSLKLAEIEFINEVAGEYPILLLDDVMSELDPGRRKYLMSEVSQLVQTFVTATDMSALGASPPLGSWIFDVSPGEVQRRRSQ